MSKKIFHAAIGHGNLYALPKSPRMSVAPGVNRAEQKFKLTDPKGYASFKKANPKLSYTQEDENHFQNTIKKPKMSVAPFVPMNKKPSNGVGVGY